MPLFSEIVINKFSHEPTRGQHAFFNEIDYFLAHKGNAVFLLKGYAGTGKTSIVSALVNTLPLFNYKFLLLAPTGRAAKVMSAYAQRMAFTIHKIIYKQKSDSATGELKFKLQSSYHKKTIFIVDEASMLSDSAEFGYSGLLQDLLKFVFTHADNKLILIGDSAQLPPVGQTRNTALTKAFYTERGDTVFEIELDEVMRQELDSGILYNATELRRRLKQGSGEIKFSTRSFHDIFRMTSEKMEEGLRYAYNKYGTANTIVVCRSNKSAVNYNLFIRRQIHFFDNELDVGDILMAVRNNYTYAPPDSPSGFLANGDFMEIVKIYGFEEQYGFRFADLELKMESSESFEAKVLLDTIYSSTTSLSSEENKELYQLVSVDYADIKPQRKMREALASDKYLNAVQVKFAYAVTCHKSQGGQWDAVFIDQGYIANDKIDPDRLKWLYTAFTRASRELFLVNFNINQFET